MPKVLTKQRLDIGLVVDDKNEKCHRLLPLSGRKCPRAFAFNMSPIGFPGSDEMAAPAICGESGRRIVGRDESQGISIPTEDVPEVGLTDACGLVQHVGKHRLSAPAPL
jgi:hypothetical protein